MADLNIPPLSSLEGLPQIVFIPDYNGPNPSRGGKELRPANLQRPPSVREMLQNIEKAVNSARETVINSDFVNPSLETCAEWNEFYEPYVAELRDIGKLTSESDNDIRVIFNKICQILWSHFYGSKPLADVASALRSLSARHWVEKMLHALWHSQKRQVDMDTVQHLWTPALTNIIYAMDVLESLLLDDDPTITFRLSEDGMSVEVYSTERSSVSDH